MKKCFLVVIVVSLLFGCSNESALMNRVVSFRNKFLNCTSCEFSAAIVLDYGDSVYAFETDCETDNENNMKFTIIRPSSIADIKGEISGGTGKLTFDEQILAFEMIANGQITPVCAPWLLAKALRGGYISSCGTGDQGMFVRIDDSFKNATFSIDVWFNNEDIPTEAEIIWEGKRIVSMTINQFVFV